MRTQTIRKAIVAVAAALVLFAAAATASAQSSSAVACTLLSSSQLKSTLGLSQSAVLRNYDPTGPGSTGRRHRVRLGRVERRAANQPSGNVRARPLRQRRPDRDRDVGAP